MASRQAGAAAQGGREHLGAVQRCVPGSRSRIWVRQLKPSARTRVSGTARRTAGISLFSAQAMDTS